MGDSIGIGRLILSYIVGGICVFILDQVMTPIMDRAAAASAGTKAATGTEWINTAFTNLPLIYALIGFVGIVAYTMWVRRGVMG